jgi:hypothetical protein
MNLYLKNLSHENPKIREHAKKELEKMGWNKSERELRLMIMERIEIASSKIVLRQNASAFVCLQKVMMELKLLCDLDEMENRGTE